MDSLNMYDSGDEVEYPPEKESKTLKSPESDANCEIMKMETSSEESASEGESREKVRSNSDRGKKNEKNNAKVEKEDKLVGNENSEKNRNKNTRRDRYKEEVQADKCKNKRDHKRKRSHRSRSRSRSKSRHYKNRSRSRSHGSKSRHRRSRSRSRSYHRRSKSPPMSHRSYVLEKGRNKLKVLEKLGIELVGVGMGVGVSGEQKALSKEEVVTFSPSGQLLQQKATQMLQKSVEEQVEQVKNDTGVQLPFYYNPLAINPVKYAEQIQKRKLLWGGKGKEEVQVKREEPSPSTLAGNTTAAAAAAKGTSIWKGVTFGDQSGKMSAKFQRLMGIKNPEVQIIPKAEGSETVDLNKKQEEMFNSMENQYEAARLATHTHRGVGLGFGTFQH